MSDRGSLVIAVQNPGRGSVDWTAVGPSFRVVPASGPCVVAPTMRSLSSSPQRAINAVIG